jgi:adenylate cyclase class 2
MADQQRETEAKFYVRNREALTRRLASVPASKLQARTLEVNLRFDNPRGDFQRENRVLRLRRDEAARLTYKEGTRAVDGALTRREIEVGVDDFDAARDFIQALGFQVVFIYEKYRTTYELDGAQIMLDELPYGDFVEIEGMLPALRPVATKLNLNWDKAVAASYHELFERIKTAQALGFRDLSFENFHETVVNPADLGVEPADG